MEDNTVCSICFLFYHNNNNMNCNTIPKKLTCGHTFCQSCILKFHKETEIVCFTCNKKTSFKDKPILPNKSNYQTKQKYRRPNVSQNNQNRRVYQYTKSKNHCMPIPDFLSQLPNFNRPIQYNCTENIKANMDKFQESEKNKQTSILGNLTYPQVVKMLLILKKSQDLAPKITGMLIDFSVFEISDIVEFLEEQEKLKKLVKEAINLLEQQ